MYWIAPYGAGPSSARHSHGKKVNNIFLSISLNIDYLVQIFFDYMTSLLLFMFYVLKPKFGMIFLHKKKI